MYRRVHPNIPPTVPLDSSGYEPIEPASPMTLESAGPPRIPVDFYLIRVCNGIVT